MSGLRVVTFRFYNLVLLEFDEGLNAAAAQHENKPVF